MHDCFFLSEMSAFYRFSMITAFLFHTTFIITRFIFRIRSITSSFLSETRQIFSLYAALPLYDRHLLFLLAYQVLSRLAWTGNLFHNTRFPRFTSLHCHFLFGRSLYFISSLRIYSLLMSLFIYASNISLPIYSSICHVISFIADLKKKWTPANFQRRIATLCSPMSGIKCRRYHHADAELPYNMPSSPDIWLHFSQLHDIQERQIFVASSRRRRHECYICFSRHIT